MKYKIEKNTVQETLILPLYSRKLCTELYPNLYRDETAVRLIDQIDYDFSEAEKSSRSLMLRFGALEVAMRQNDLAFEVQAYLKTHPTAAVVNLGCGLDNTGRACDNGRFTKCGICVLMKELGLYDLTPALCHLDYTMSEAGGVTNFMRQYTLASGGPYCDCGYKKKG